MLCALKWEEFDKRQQNKTKYKTNFGSCPGQPGECQLGTLRTTKSRGVGLVRGLGEQGKGDCHRGKHSWQSG